MLPPPPPPSTALLSCCPEARRGGSGIATSKGVAAAMQDGTLALCKKQYFAGEGWGGGAVQDGKQYMLDGTLALCRKQYFVGEC